MSIVFFDVEEWERVMIPKKIAGEAVLLVGERLTKDSVAQATQAKVVAVFAWSKITEEVLESMPALRHIATRSTGYDHIDLAACQRRGISVSNVPTYGDRTVAEHTFALMLALSRRLFQAGRRGREGNFSREGLRGFDLTGRILGIVGCGKIGRKVAEIGRAFEMKVVVFDPKQDARMANKIGFSYVETIDDLLTVADVISLHAPLNEKTRHLINLDTINKIKSGAILINTARGDLVQTAALLKALDEGRLEGAGLDVLENETLIGEEAEVLSRGAVSNADLSGLLRNHILFSHPNVIVTPHNAFNSEEAVTKILDTSINNIEAFLLGNKNNIVST